MKITASIVRLFALAILATLASGASSADTYPAKTVRWLVPSAAGGAFDVMTRGLAPAMTEQTGQTFYVDNIGGAAGLLGMETGARAPHDGYTILTAGTSQLVMNPFFHKALPYDPEKDFDGVGLLGSLPIALWATSSVPVKDYAGLVEYTKAHPRELNYGSAGVGHVFHLGMEVLGFRTGLLAVHVPYKGVGPAIQDFLAGRIQLMFSVPQRPIMAQYRAGKIRPIAAATAKRVPGLPGIPTFDELHVDGMELPNWVGLVVPQGTPRAIVARLNRELAKATRSELARKTYAGMGMEIEQSSPEAFERRIRDEARQWGRIIVQLGIKPQ